MKQIKLTCKIEKKDDHYSLKLPEDYKKHMHLLMKYCFDKKGGFCSFTISAPKRKRSTGKGSQSHKVNGSITQISLETGQSFDDIKKYCKAEATVLGYPILEVEGNQVLDLWGNVQGISEADCTVEECSFLIKAIQKLADEFNIKLYGEDI